MKVPAQKSFHRPDNRLTMEKGNIDIVEIGGAGVGLATFQPGWRWSTQERPAVGAEGAYCQVPHFVYLERGHLTVEFEDGAQLHLGPGDVAIIPAGHDGWVIGDEAAVMFDFGALAGAS